MHHENLNILIQCRLSEFFSINNFNLAGSWKGFFGGVNSLSELLPANWMSALLRGSKSMPRTTSMLMLASKKVS